MKSPIRVAIVEDNARLRQQFVRLLGESPGFISCGVYPDAESALKGLPASPADVVLMDIQLPRMSGVECVGRLKMQMPNLDVVMLTVYDDSELIFRALENGATGYLLKRTPPAEILRAIEEVQRGGAPMSGHIARMVVQSMQRRGPSPHAVENLSPREEEVLRLVSKGLVNKEIADELGIALETVRGYLKSIYSKLHVRSRTEAAMKYYR
jgi:DNA-binding NarL/FixJ family response regulator